MTDMDTSGAFIYAFPIYEMAKLRWNALYDRGNAVFTGLNRFWHQEQLATHADRWVTTPNVDTLYSTAWVALDQGPVRLDVPPTDGRYLSVAMLDMFTDNFFIINARNCGSGGGSFVIVGPDSDVAAPDNARIVHAPSNDVMLFARVLAGAGDDVRQARAYQQQLSVTPLGTVRELPPLQRADSPGADSVALLRDALARNPPRAYEAAMRQTLIALGLMRAQHDAVYASPQRFAESWATNLAALRAAMSRGRPPVEGWSYPQPATGDFGTFYRQRAAVALGGLLALPQTEAIYLGAVVDAGNAPLTGANRYLLRIPSGGVPADSFWSLTMYEDAENGARYLVDNPIARYCLNDRSPDLAIKPDGSIDILLQKERPAGNQLANWLPAPEGPFRVVLRAYLPRASLIDNRFRMPPVAKIA